ncbi:hypothetical protein D5F01_LYC19018 [Larimichthys crocea]|uniref:ribonuclease H n=1 Tax=Larimichthys crocea TaxID=215358 RepID=A0A6G0HWP5_LARCR|nr:hypothetical protein D5F01_LYC19018 [Larimichthys crocea]
MGSRGPPAGAKTEQSRPPTEQVQQSKLAAKKGGYLPPEEYNKLTPEQRRALQSTRAMMQGGGPQKLAKQSQGKTAFTHKGKAYVLQRLPQGYKNSPNVFLAAVMDVLKDFGVTIYIDDVFLADDTKEEHLQRLQQVVERLTDAGLKLNLKKCQFGQFRKYAKPLYACLKKKGEESGEGTQKKWSWKATDHENMERLKAVIQDAIRLEPRSLTTRQVSCEDDDAVVKVKNEGGGMVTLWSYTLSSVEKKFPQEEKELAVLARYWGTMKDLAQGQGIKVITQSQVHRYLRKETIESTKATNTRWGRWEDILLDPDLEIGPAQPANRKAEKPQETEEKSYEWILYTDG